MPTFDHRLDLRLANVLVLGIASWRPPAADRSLAPASLSWSRMPIRMARCSPAGARRARVARSSCSHGRSVSELSTLVASADGPGSARPRGDSQRRPVPARPPSDVPRYMLADVTPTRRSGIRYGAAGTDGVGVLFYRIYAESEYSNDPDGRTTPPWRHRLVPGVW
jgi:hypothetical protein